MLLLLLSPAIGPAQEVEQQTGSGTLTITITSVANNQGQLEIGLYAHSQGFLHIENAFRRAVVEAEQGTTLVRMDEVPNGTYAIALFHDENGNTHLDTNFFHLPAEGTGLSNGARAHFGPPRFRDATFTVSGDTETTVAVHY